jgi:hypothetical protein
MYNFKTEFNTQLSKVCSLYKEAKIFLSEDKKGFILYPSLPSVPRNVVKLSTKVNNQPNIATIAEDDTNTEVLAVIINEFGLSPKLTKQLIENKTVLQIAQSIASVREIIKAGKAINIKALIRKALEEEWKPKIDITVTYHFDKKVEVHHQCDENSITNPEWKIVRTNLKNIVGEATFNSWLKKLKIVSCEGETVIFAVPSKFIKDYIDTKYTDIILQAWSQVNCNVKAIQIEFVISKIEDTALPREA